LTIRLTATRPVAPLLFILSINGHLGRWQPLSRERRLFARFQELLMRIVSATFVAALGVLTLAAVASAQAPYPNAGFEQAGYSPVSSQTAAPPVQTTSFERKTGRNNPALNFFGGAKNSTYAPQGRSVQPPPPVAVQTKPMGKPFSSYRASSPISPYLGLDYIDTAVTLPTYFMFVRPQLDQDQVNRETRNDNRALRSTVRKARADGAVTSPAGGIPTTGHSSQFMNGGGYYPVAR
jgi:hypothetical protein